MLTDKERREHRKQATQRWRERNPDKVKEDTMKYDIREPIGLSSDSRGLTVSTGKTTYHVHSDEMTAAEQAVHQSLTEHGDCVCLACCAARVRNLLSQA